MLQAPENIGLENSSSFPSFSIVYETENLSSVELENIYRSLDSIASQDIPPKMANEFLIIDSGDAPKQLIEELCLNYTWITVKKVPAMEYYEAKMAGAKLVTGEVIVFADSDCEYSQNWLRDILTTFRENPSINIVAGETSTKIRNPYELAIALNYFFPRFSGRESPYKSKQYFLNNVAFRKKFLLSNPIPTNLPIFRGNCALHTHYLCNLKEYYILNCPKAHAFHEPPTPSFSFWRYILKGHDRVFKDYMKRKMSKDIDLNTLASEIKDRYDLDFKQKIYGSISAVLRVKPIKGNRINLILRDNPDVIIYFPVAIIISLWFELLHAFGEILTYFYPNYLIDLYQGLQLEHGNQK